MANLQSANEFRYIIQWFSEFSELQRQDFLPILVDYLLKNDELVLNGLINDMAEVSTENKPPLSLFQCRMKLFKQWSKGWDNNLRSQLIEKINSIDSGFADKLNVELEEMLKNDNADVPNGVLQNGFGGQEVEGIGSD